MEITRKDSEIRFNGEQSYKYYLGKHLIFDGWKTKVSAPDEQFMFHLIVPNNTPIKHYIDKKESYIDSLIFNGKCNTHKELTFKSLEDMEKFIYG